MFFPLFFFCLTWMPLSGVIYRSLFDFSIEFYYAIAFIPIGITGLFLIMRFIDNDYIELNKAKYFLLNEVELKKNSTKMLLIYICGILFSWGLFFLYLLR